MVHSISSSVLISVLFLSLSYYTVRVSSQGFQTNDGVTSHEESSSFGNELLNHPDDYSSISSEVTDKMGSTVSNRGHAVITLPTAHNALPSSSSQSCNFTIVPRTSFQPNVYGAYCTCDGIGRGRLYAIEDDVKDCVQTCMTTHHGAVCSAGERYAGFEDEFSSCCTNCSGQRSIIDVTHNRATGYRGRFTGCIAAANPVDCQIEVGTSSSLALPNIQKSCNCGRLSSGRIFGVCDSLKTCMEPCMTTDQGNSCDRSTVVSTATSNFTTCCNTCSGHLVHAKYGSTIYTSCM